MEIGKTLYVRNRKEWRRWLQENHDIKKEIWLIYYKKDSGRPRLPYNDAVEEALCFGWIDSIAKKLDDISTVQRFSPRRKKSFLSELNKERVRNLIDLGLMTQAGLESIMQHLELCEDGNLRPKEYVIPDDIIAELKRDKIVWNNYLAFPENYKKIRIAFIDGGRNRPEIFRQRLNYFIKMTAQNKRYGTIK